MIDITRQTKIETRFMFDNNKMEVLLSEEKIQKRIEELATQISADYRGKNPVVVGVLKGSFIFMADLVRKISLPLTCDFLRVSSYERDRSTGVVRMEFDMTQPIAGKDVLLVEDIVDTGRTLKFLKSYLATKNPASLRLCTFLYKDVGTVPRESIEYVGFTIPNRYVFGYGLDSEGVFRSLPYLAAFKSA